MVAVYILQMFYFSVVKPGVIISLMFVILWLLNVKKLLYLGFSKYWQFNLFLFSAILSASNYDLSSDTNIELYFYGIVYQILPMIYFYLGTMISNDRFHALVKRLIIANVIICLSGLIFFFHSFLFYVDYRRMLNESYMLSLDETSPRLASFIGSVIVGNICANSIPLLFLLFVERKLRLFNLVALYIVFVLCLALTFQRGAWVAMIISMVIGIAASLKMIIKNPIAYTSVIFGSILLGFITIQYASQLGGIEWFLGRIDSIKSGEAIEERSDQWGQGLFLFVNRPLGYGIGCFSHKAISLGNTGIPDGNYFLILVEQGLIGFSLFSIVVITACVKSFLHNKYIFACLVVFLIQAIGSNLLEFTYVSSLFWLLIGISFRSQKREGNCSRVWQRSRLPANGASGAMP
jgi:O-Antigen ligase